MPGERLLNRGPGLELVGAPIDALRVARWMAAELKRNRRLDQGHAAYEIRRVFGERFVYLNKNGNLAIGKEVLAEFRDLTEETVIWENGSKSWRLRTRNDPPGRRQID